MKICILGNAQSPHIRRWAQFFHKRGHEVNIVSARPDKLEGLKVYSPKLPFETLLRRRQTFDEDRTPNLAVYLSYIILTLTIRRLLRKLSPDILMAMTMETNGIISLASGHHPTALFHLGCKALSIKSETSLLMRLLVKAMIRFADMLYTGDSAGVDRLQKLGASREEIYVNPWGIELDRLPSKAKAMELRRELGGEGKKLFVCIRVFLPEYDVATFIRAIPQIITAYPNTGFIVVGEGPERENLEKLVAELRIDRFVNFVGFVPYEMLTTYLAASDFYVDPVNYPLPSRRTWWGHRTECSMDGNGYSITLLMALATGSVPLITQRGGLSDIFDEEARERLLWDPGSFDQLAEKAKRLLGLNETCVALRSELIELARRRFDWAQNALEVEDDYLRTVSRFRESKSNSPRSR